MVVEVSVVVVVMRSVVVVVDGSEVDVVVGSVVVVVASVLVLVPSEDVDIPSVVVPEMNKINIRNWMMKIINAKCGTAIDESRNVGYSSLFHTCYHSVTYLGSMWDRLRYFRDCKRTLQHQRLYQLDSSAKIRFV